MELSLAGKRALVTGASGGLGLHFAGTLARAGAEVTLAARRRDRVEGAAADLRALGLRAGAAELDVTDADTNLTGVFAVAQAAARQMAAAQGGAIVNIASILGVRVAGHVAAYAASKAGVVQLTRALALEWARHGIRVNALCPGYVETPLNAAFFASDAGQALIRRIPQRRLGQPSDLDAPLLLLASDAGAYITGSIVAVDDGHLVSSL